MEDNVPKKTPLLPPNYVSILDLQQRWLKQQQQQQQRVKDTQKRESGVHAVGDGKETESQEKRENGVQPILQYEKRKKNRTDPSGEKGCRWVKLEKEGKQHVGREEIVRIEGKEGNWTVHGGEERERDAEKVENKGEMLEKKWRKKRKGKNFGKWRREREREKRREREVAAAAVVSEAKEEERSGSVGFVEEERGSGSGGGDGEGRKEGNLVKGGGDHVYWKKRGEEGKRKVVEGGRGNGGKEREGGGRVVVDDCGEGGGDMIGKKGKGGVSGNVGVVERGFERGSGDVEGRKEGNLEKGGCDHVYGKKIGNGGKEGEGGSDCGEGRGGDVIGKKFEEMSVRGAAVKGNGSGGRRWSYNGGGVWRGLSEGAKKKGVESGLVWVVKT